jgi:hypothetical protein
MGIAANADIGAIAVIGLVARGHVLLAPAIVVSAAGTLL